MARVAFISDIHSNVDALEAALAHIDKTGVDMTLCLGDVVGYGPAPTECIALIRQREIPTVLGNHDEYATLIDDPHVKNLKPEIQQAVAWTQAQLSMEDLRWLAALPKEMDAEVFGVVHSSFSKKSRWAYCMDEGGFQENFKYQTYQLAFCGHSHRPLIGYTLEEDTEEDPPMVKQIRERTLPTTGKIMVNVGSVGQPRDGHTEACVVFYDTDTRALRLDRVPYDLKAAYRRFGKTDLPRRFADRIMLGK